MSDTKEKIVALADQLVRTKGYNAFSYKDISEPLSIKNAAIHYHFPAKGDLGIGVIEREIKKFNTNTNKWKHLPEDEQLNHLFEVFNTSSKKGVICLMGSLTPDYDTLPEAMQEKVQEMGNGILNWLSNCLENGRSKHLLHFEGAAYDRALLVISNLQSSLLLSRVLGRKTFTRISNQLLKDLH